MSYNLKEQLNGYYILTINMNGHDRSIYLNHKQYLDQLCIDGEVNEDKVYDYILEYEMKTTSGAV